MSKIYGETRHIIRSVRFVSSLIFLIYTICCCLGLFSLTAYRCSQNQKKEYAEKFLDRAAFQVIDKFDMANYHSGDDALSLKKLNLSLKNADFTYISTTLQMCLLYDNLPNEKFLNRYEQGDSGNSCYEDKNYNNGDRVCEIKSAWVGDNVFKACGLKMSEGSWFSANDFIYGDNTVKPVVLGYEYKEYYKVGDIIRFKELFSDCEKFRVIGFLEKGSMIYKQNSLENIDRFVVLPFYDVENISESKYAERIYLEKNSGVALTDKTADHVQSYINDKCKEFGITPAFGVIGAGNQTTLLFGYDLEAVLNLMKLICIFTYLFIVITMCIFMIITIRKNLKYYAVLLINGYTYTDIKKMIVLQTTLLSLRAFIIASVLMLAVSFVFFGTVDLISFLVIFAVCLFISAVSSFIGINELKRYDLSLYLRKR